MIPFWGLELVGGHQGQIPSSCYLAQSAGPTLSLDQESLQLENRDHGRRTFGLLINCLSLGHYTTPSSTDVKRVDQLS